MKAGRFIKAKGFAIITGATIILFPIETLAQSCYAEVQKQFARVNKPEKKDSTRWLMSYNGNEFSECRRANTFYIRYICGNRVYAMLESDWYPSKVSDSKGNLWGLRQHGNPIVVQKECKQISQDTFTETRVEEISFTIEGTNTQVRLRILDSQKFKGTNPSFN